MGSMSIWHWVIVLVVVLLLFGAKRIPDLASSLGAGIKNFKKSVKDEEEKQADTTVTATATPVQGQTAAQTTPSSAHDSAKPTDSAKV